MAIRLPPPPYTHTKFNFLTSEQCMEYTETQRKHPFSAPLYEQGQDICGTFSFIGYDGPIIVSQGVDFLNREQ